MEVIIEESGLRFGKFKEDQVFRIEESEQYTKSLRSKGIKCCEFILKRGKKLYFFEAKSSCPKQIIKDIPADEKEERIEAYNQFIEEIVLKMRHSLSLYGSILLKRHSQDHVPAKLTNPDLSSTLICLVLVINTGDENWEPEPALRDDIQQHLKKEIRIWKTEQFIVINAQQARENHFII